MQINRVRFDLKKYQKKTQKFGYGTVWSNFFLFDSVRFGSQENYLSLTVLKLNSQK